MCSMRACEPDFLGGLIAQAYDAGVLGGLNHRLGSNNARALAHARTRILTLCGFAEIGWFTDPELDQCKV